MKKFWKRNRYFHADRIAMRIAARYDMTLEYKMSRRQGMCPIDALDDWDLLTNEDYVRYKNELNKQQ